METIQVEVWILVDESGDSGVGSTQEEALENYQANIDNDLSGSRYYQVMVPVPKPVPVKLTGKVAPMACEDREVELSVAEVQ